jgi:glutamine amidotransferase PdxT
MPPVGVLALQGDWQTHMNVIESLGAQARPCGQRTISRRFAPSSFQEGSPRPCFA